MGFELNDNSGFIFKNDRRSNDRQPTHQGQCKINGEEFWVSCWIKDGKKGKFFSCSFNPKDEQQLQRKPARSYTPPADDFDDDVPF